LPQAQTPVEEHLATPTGISQKPPFPTSQHVGAVPGQALPASGAPASRATQYVGQAFATVSFAGQVQAQGELQSPAGHASAQVAVPSTASQPCAFRPQHDGAVPVQPLPASTDDTHV
jgi:hypothetical protein